ncbi:MAG: DMT family transporter [Candidatus Eisenbacteria bacterium]|uniref:DMT family transporter n=1 Tax=Eiseniibacteriota bacterium TaxID=2212470 RepID=A0A948W916_UNCEI|nr:DMT family transporter [Candidatus Eisenbacteria bacterium]MBU1948592.1 DMT family transporter [Candidatus Eisenbacteria bacterium]MBU2693281.1 DMT family transporter [Candidatus Eisenbacteria bacterium]
MTLHTTSGRWKLGFLLSVITALLWGALPIALKTLLGGMDAITITWYRFLASAVLLAAYLAARRRRARSVRPKGLLLLLIIVCCLCLCANYIIYLIGLDHLTPSIAQVVIQLAPGFMLLGGVFIYRERFVRLQWTGMLVFVAGMGLFFNGRLALLIGGLTDYTIGILLIITAAIAWAVYGLTQKQLLRCYSSEMILLVIYIFGAVAFFPAAHPGQIATLNTLQVFLLIFAALNTLFAYGCFAEALEHWEASRVSAVLATVPVLTVFLMMIVSSLWPQVIEPENLSPISLAGALLVVGGSIMAAVSSDPKHQIPPLQTPEP